MPLSSGGQLSLAGGADVARWLMLRRDEMIMLLFRRASCRPLTHSEQRLHVYRPDIGTISSGLRMRIFTYVSSRAIRRYLVDD